GDGFVCARVLRAQGVSVRVLAVGDVGRVEGAARNHLRLLEETGPGAEGFGAGVLGRADVVVDAIFGTGFHGTAAGEAAAAIDAINRSGLPVVAVDIPSGVSGANGAVERPVVKATLTVAMGAEKIGTAVTPG